MFQVFPWLFSGIETNIQARAAPILTYQRQIIILHNFVCVCVCVWFHHLLTRFEECDYYCSLMRSAWIKWWRRNLVKTNFHPNGLELWHFRRKYNGGISCVLEILSVSFIHECSGETCALVKFPWQVEKLAKWGRIITNAQRARYQ